MINYSLGPVIGSACDSLRTGIITTDRRLLPFTISPNPVTSEVNILKIEEFAGGKSYYIKLINDLGQVVFERNMRPDEYSFSVMNLSPGLYFLQLKSQAGVFTDRVIKIDAD